MSFAITVLPAIHGHRWVILEGPVTAATIADVRAMIATSLREPSPHRLTIDAREAHIDQVGRACLAEMSAAVTKQGVQVRLLAFEDESAWTLEPEPGLRAPATSEPVLVAG